MSWLVAHQGGWDEVVLFAIPVIAAIFLVRWAEKRSRRKRDESPTEDREETPAE